MKTHRFLLLAAVLIVSFIVSGEEAVFADGPSVGPLMLVSGPTPFEQGCEGPFFGFINYVNYKVEPYIVVNPVDPLNIVASWMQDAFVPGGSKGIVSAVSHDGGATWRQVIIPQITRCSGGSLQITGDPWLSFAPNGDLYHSALSTNGDFTGISLLVSKSTDGGDTWSAPITVHTDTTPTQFDDKDSITADPYDSRYVYVAWHSGQSGPGTQPTPNAGHSRATKGPSWFTRTTDGGATWERARMIFDPGEHNSTTGNQIVVLPNGDLLNAFALTTDEQNFHKYGMSIAFIRSSDKGETWSGPQIVSTFIPVYVNDPTTNEMLNTGSRMIDIAVDKKSGNIYIVWEDGRFSGYAVEGIAFTKSTDGGRTWSEPVQINKAISAPAFTPSVAVADDGAVAVTYYDLRNDTSDPTVLQTDHWVIVSRDGGNTWAESHVGGPFDMRSAPEPGVFMYFIGDYVGLASSGNSFVAAFPMTNQGVPSNPTDIFVSTITP